jgi:hypothetical protein
MKPSKMYVPDPQIWVEYCKKEATAKTGLSQSGGGKIITIDDGKSREQKPKRNDLVFEIVITSSADGGSGYRRITQKQH